MVYISIEVNYCPRLSCHPLIGFASLADSGRKPISSERNQRAKRTIAHAQSREARACLAVPITQRELCKPRAKRSARVGLRTRRSAIGSDRSERRIAHPTKSGSEAESGSCASILKGAAFLRG